MDIPPACRFGAACGAGFRLEGDRNKVLVLAGQATANASVLDALRNCCNVVEIGTIDQAISGSAAVRRPTDGARASLIAQRLQDLE